MIYGFELETNETNKNQNRLYVHFFFVVFLLFFTFCFLVVLCHCRCSDKRQWQWHWKWASFNIQIQSKPIETHIKWHNWGKTLIWDFLIHWLYATDHKRLDDSHTFPMNLFFFFGLSSFFSLFLHRYCQIIIYQSKWWPHISRWLKN